MTNLGTRPKSRRLRVSTVKRFANAMAAIFKSSVPTRTREARTQMLKLAFAGGVEWHQWKQAKHLFGGDSVKPANSKRHRFGIWGLHCSFPSLRRISARRHFRDDYLDSRRMRSKIAGVSPVLNTPHFQSKMNENNSC